MSRRLLMASKAAPKLPSKITFKTVENTTVLNFNVIGHDIVLKDKDNNIISSVSQGTLSNVSVSPTTINDFFTIEASDLTSCSFSYWSQLSSVSEFTVPNSNTIINNCFDSCTSLTEVRNINIQKLASIVFLFGNCTNLTHIDSFYVNKNVNANYCFYQTRVIANPIINIEEVKFADYLFANNPNFNDITSLQNKDLKWISCDRFIYGTAINSVSNLTFTNLQHLSFASHSNLTSITNLNLPVCNTLYLNYSVNLTTINNINAPSLSNIPNLCTGCSSLATILNLNTASLINVTASFMGCTSLTAVPTLNLAPDVYSFSSAFSGCTSLTDLTLIENYINNKTSETSLDCSNTFRNCTSILTLPNIDFNKVDNCSYMFSNTGISSVSNLSFLNTDVRGFLYNCSNLTTVGNLTFTNCTDIIEFLGLCPNLTNVGLITVNESNINLSLTSMFIDCSLLNNVTITGNITSTNVNFSSVFKNCTSLTNATVSVVCNYSADEMFMGCTSLTTLPNIDFSKLKSSWQMFANCSGLNTGIGDLNLPISTATVGMFYGCSLLPSVGNISAPESTVSYNMFYNCTSLTSVGTVTINNAGNVSGFFNNCYLLQSVGNLSFNSAITLSSFFMNCTALSTVGIINANLVENAEYLFTNCSSLVNINLNFPKCLNYNVAFSSCTSLITAVIGDPDETVSVKISGYSMFRDCNNLNSVTINLSKYTNMSEMFMNCSSLNYNLNNLILNQVSSTNRMFYNSGISSITNFSVSGTNLYFYEMFAYCSNLTSVNGFSVVTDSVYFVDGSYVFSFCVNLSSIQNITLNGRINCTGFLTNTGNTTLDLELLDLTSNSNASYFISNNAITTSITNLKTTAYASNIVNNLSELTTIGTLEILSNSVEDITVPFASVPKLANVNTVTCNSTGRVRLDGSSALLSVLNINIPNCLQFSIAGATNLTTVNQITGNNLTNISNLVDGCKLTSFPIINTSNVSDFSYSFKGNKVSIYNNNYDLSKANFLTRMFENCSDLTSVTINDVFTPSLGTVSAGLIFSNCPSLTNVTVNDASKWKTGGAVDGFFGVNSAITDLVFNNYNFTIIIPPLITDVVKLEAIVNSAGTNPSWPDNKIIMGATRQASISTTVINNALAKGWVIE